MPKPEPTRDEIDRLMRVHGFPDRSMDVMVPKPEVLTDDELGRYYAKLFVDEDTKCWPWHGCRNADGYGRFWLRGRVVNAHRVGYELLRGPIPEGLVIDHLCRNRWCQNPYHMEPVKQSENVARGESFAPRNASKTRCPEGHPYSGDNLRLEPRRNGRSARRCRACAATAMERFNARQA